MVQKRRKKAKPIPEPVKPQPPAKCIGCEWGTFTGKSLYCPRMPCVKASAATIIAVYCSERIERRD